jgi:hypothetical protein
MRAIRAGRQEVQLASGAQFGVAFTGGGLLDHEAVEEIAADIELHGASSHAASGLDRSGSGR